MRDIGGRKTEKDPQTQKFSFFLNPFPFPRKKKRKRNHKEKKSASLDRRRRRRKKKLFASSRLFSSAAV